MSKLSFIYIFLIFACKPTLSSQANNITTEQINPKFHLKEKTPSQTLGITQKLIMAFKKYDQAREADPFLIKEFSDLDNRLIRGLAKKILAMKVEDFDSLLQKNGFYSPNKSQSLSLTDEVIVTNDLFQKFINRLKILQKILSENDFAGKEILKKEFEEDLYFIHGKLYHYNNFVKVSQEFTFAYNGQKIRIILKRSSYYKFMLYLTRYPEKYESLSDWVEGLKIQYLNLKNEMKAEHRTKFEALFDTDFDELVSLLQQKGLKGNEAKLLKFRLAFPDDNDFKKGLATFKISLKQRMDLMGGKFKIGETYSKEDSDNYKRNQIKPFKSEIEGHVFEPDPPQEFERDCGILSCFRGRDANPAHAAVHPANEQGILDRVRRFFWLVDTSDQSKQSDTDPIDTLEKDLQEILQEKSN